MMKHEFEVLIGREIAPDEYAEIEYVYNFHPAIPDVGGKKKIAELYKVGGLGLIRVMYPCAWESEQREKRRQEIDNEIRKLSAEMNKLLSEAQSIQNMWNA